MRGQIVSMRSQNHRASNAGMRDEMYVHHFRCTLTLNLIKLSTKKEEVMFLDGLRDREDERKEEKTPFSERVNESSMTGAKFDNMIK